MNIQNMMNTTHNVWQEQYYQQLMERKFFLQERLNAEELTWLCDYQSEKICESYMTRPDKCYSCGADLTGYSKSMTGCPLCHHSFVE